MGIGGGHMLRRSRKALLTIALVALALASAACQANGDATPTNTPLSPQPLSADQIITLGDVDPDEPIKKINRFQPLADYLASHLKDQGILKGQVVIASNIEEIGQLLKDGTVDIYFDSPFPALAVQKQVGSQIILRRWKEGTPTYWSLYVASKELGIASAEEFRGKVIAFEEPRSTSGFLLPASTLIQRGFTLTEVSGPSASVAPAEIGYVFSRDEENTIEMVLSGHVAGGGISNGDYDELPPELMERLTTFGRTISVPRQLVSVRPGLDPALVTQLR